MAPCVIVIGHGYTSRLGIVRSLGSSGFKVVVVAISGHVKQPTVKGEKPIDYYSKYVSEFYFCPNEGDILVQFLITKFGNISTKSIIIPDSDFSAYTIDRYTDILKDFFLFPNIQMTSGLVEYWMNKSVQKNRASQYGLAIANDVIIKVESTNIYIPETVHYPCFCKPIVTIVGSKTGLKKCDSQAELLEHLRYLYHKFTTIDVLVEDYINIEEEYALVGLSDGQNIIIPGIFHILEMAGGSHFGVTRKGEILPNSDFDNVISKFESFVKSIHFVGLFDIDFFLSNGCYYFDELNLRFGGSGYAFTKMGVNLPNMLVDVLINKQIHNKVKPIELRCTYINERMCLDDWYKCNISTNHLFSLFRTTDVSFVKDDIDKAPFSHFKVLLLKTAFKRMIRKFYHWIK